MGEGPGLLEWVLEPLTKWPLTRQDLERSLLDAGGLVGVRPRHFVRGPRARL